MASPMTRDWDARMQAARHALADARAAIDALSELAEGDVDMHVCFAGNTLHGADALLDRADAAFQREVKVS